MSTTQIYTHVAIGKLKAIHASTHPMRQGPVDWREAITLLLTELEREAREEPNEADDV
ncbi:hypothetical protein [Burkholderia sp. IMCC1007]|uniref:hypothetical protein n=1 Tax=Burkholderia sp. IMCC1007 TaxID=3004104 RepID=UPI0022B3E800|nr:hypothetical protein [Burkholderia sp. IMCC1007]